MNDEMEMSEAIELLETGMVAVQTAAADGAEIISALRQVLVAVAGAEYSWAKIEEDVAYTAFAAGKLDDDALAQYVENKKDWKGIYQWALLP